MSPHLAQHVLQLLQMQVAFTDVVATLLWQLAGT